jgi:hypothetical protein
MPDHIHGSETIMDVLTTGNQREFPRQQTIEFAPTPQRLRERSEEPAISERVTGLTPVDPQYMSDLSEYFILVATNFNCSPL